MIEWRPIPGWEEYEISSADAMVRKVSTGKELTQYANAWGLVQVRLAKSRTQRSWWSVIRLHKLAFPELHVKAPKPVPMPEPMEGEEFREYGKYLVSNLGRVWSTHKRRYVKRVLGQLGAQRLVEEVFGHDIPTLPGEVWKTHPRFKGYAFSNLGRMYGFYRRTILTDKINEKYIRFNYNGKHIRLHRVIAEIFVPNPDNLPEVDHINENRYDNRACNLRWSTKEQNINYYAENHYR